MKILRLYPFLPPETGGLEKHVAQLSIEQRKMGHDVTVMFNQGERTSRDDIKLLEFIRMRKVRPQFVRDLLYYSSAFMFLVKKKFRFDIVHVHGDWSAFLFGIPVSLTVGRPRLVASIHGKIKSGNLWRFIYNVILKRFDVVYATGKNEADALSALTKRKVYWRSSGVNNVFFKDLNVSPGERRVDVVAVSNFYPVKNPGLFVSIASCLPQYRFHIIGDGPLLPSLKSQCDEAGVSNVEFLGSMTQSMVSECLMNSKIFLSTSFSEGTPTAMIEAMAAGLVVVTSNSNNYESLVENGKNGYIIDGFSAFKYAEIIESILSDGARMEEMARLNIAVAKKYSWPEVAKLITFWSLPVEEG